MNWRNPRKMPRRCMGCVRAQECKYTYWKDGVCAYRVLLPEYKNWLLKHHTDPYSAIPTEEEG